MNRWFSNLQRFGHTHVGFGDLAHRLLLDKPQRPAGRVGVHRSALIRESPRHKLLKNNWLTVFQIGAFWTSPGTGNSLEEKGSGWAGPAGCYALVSGTLIAIAASNR
jgi:hypothetical protein